MADLRRQRRDLLKTTPVPDLSQHLTQGTVSQVGTDFCLFNCTPLQTTLIVANSNDVALRLASDAADLKVVLNLAEITDSKHIKNLKILFIRIVDLVLGITGNEQHSSGFNLIHDTFNGDCPTP